MGEVFPGECTHAALGKGKHAMMESSSKEYKVWLIWELLAEATVAGGSAVEEEEGETMPKEGGKGDYPTEGLITAEEQAPKLQVVLPVTPKFWAAGPSGEAIGCRLATPEGPGEGALHVGGVRTPAICQ